jgi:hypothetical protein
MDVDGWKEVTLIHNGELVEDVHENMWMPKVQFLLLFLHLDVFCLFAS